MVVIELKQDTDYHHMKKISPFAYRTVKTPIPELKPKDNRLIALCFHSTNPVQRFFLFFLFYYMLGRIYDLFYG